MLHSLLTFYILYELRMCECISRAAENVIRNQITSQALDKIEEIEIEQENEKRRIKKDKINRRFCLEQTGKRRFIFYIRY